MMKAIFAFGFVARGLAAQSFPWHLVYSGDCWPAHHLVKSQCEDIQELSDSNGNVIRSTMIDFVVTPESSSHPPACYLVFNESERKLQATWNSFAFGLTKPTCEVNTCICDGVGPTPTPTVSPPTETPTFIPTDAPTASVLGAIEDPHITNVYGQHFQMHKSGRFNMLILRQTNGEPVFGIKANMIALYEVPCSSTFIRQVEVQSSNRSIRVRRGFSMTQFTEKTNESLEISFNGDRWLSHGEPLTFDQSELHVSQSGECSPGLKHADCRTFIVSSPFCIVKVSAGTSPNHKRHFLNLEIPSVNLSSDVEASGLLWSDQLPVDDSNC